MKKRYLFILLITLLMLNFSACNKEITAENLVEDALSKANYVEYMLNCDMIFTGEEYGYKVDYVANLDTFGKVCKLVSFQDTKFVFSTNIEELGYEDTATTEYNEYQVIEDDKEYYYLQEESVWERYTYDKENRTLLPGFDESMFAELELETLENGYKVSGKMVDDYPITVFEGGIINGVLDDVGDCEKQIIFIFDEGRVLEKIEVLVDLEEDKLYTTSTFGENYMEDIVITIEFISYEGDVTLPEEVEKNAVEASDDEESEDEADTEEQSIYLGVITDNTYTNESMKLMYEAPDESWKLLSRNEMDTLYNASVVILKDELGNLLANATNVMDLYAMNTSTMANINMMIEKVPSSGEIYDEEAYYTGLKETLYSTYAEYGYEDVEIQVGEVTFLGETHKCLVSEYTYMSMHIYTVQVVVYEGNCQAIISSGSYQNEEEAKAALAYFKRIEE